MNEELGPRFADALGYVVHVHADQRRKGTDVPYVAHLLAVTGLVIEDGAATGRLREDEAIAALLHDSAEDQGGEARLADIVERFGERVAQIVRACSDSLSEDGDKAPWRERKEAYLAHLESEADLGVLRVSLADKVSNARAVLADYPRPRRAVLGAFQPRRRHPLVLPPARRHLHHPPPRGPAHQGAGGGRHRPRGGDRRAPGRGRRRWTMT